MATIIVNDSGDNGPGTLRAAIAGANAGDTIVFDPGLAGRTITLASTLAINTPISIDGSAAPGLIVSGNNAVTDFSVNFTKAGTATIEYLEIANGHGVGSAGAAGQQQQATPAAAMGGAGGAAAGGIYFQNGTLNLVGDKFVNDEATGGAGGAGGVYNMNNAGFGAAGGAGGDAAGAVYVAPGVVVSASGLSFIGDSATAGSGGAGNQSLGTGKPNTPGASGNAYPDSNSSVVTNAVCFVSGTRIRTMRGDRPVENLVVGDAVFTTSGDARPIRWLGHRSVGCRNHPRPHEAQPIRIAAHAFGENRPARDLRVSPGHAICVDLLGEVLIPAGALVNGSTIVQEDVDHVTYWHVELEGGHDVILAENLPCESYMEMGNRGFFAESGVTTLHAIPDAPVPTHADFCRPFHAEGALVDAVRAQLLARAEKLGWHLEDVSLEGNLHLVVDGVRLEPEVHGLAARFLVPADAKTVWLVSATSVPVHLNQGADLRALGVCLSSVTIADGFGAPLTIQADDPRLCIGFHDMEAGPQRWTAGRARLPADLWDGCRGSLFLRAELTRPALPRWVAPAASVPGDERRVG